MFRRPDNAARRDNGGPETRPPARVELPRRVVDVPVAPSAQHSGTPATGRVAVGGEPGPVLVHDGSGGEARAASTGERRLVVGAGIEIKGEVKGCETLRIDGDLEATVAASEHLVIGAEGALRGICEVESADVAGSFEGTLTVRGRLLVRGTGAVRGEVRFGELEIERGGRLSGEVDAHAKGPKLATVTAAGGDG